jgi:DNA-binding NarL/FixJ family response regulator
VLDARLPDGSGIEVCREIRSSLPSVACLILTSYDDDESLFAAIMAGAAGYVLKQIRGTDLVAAVHRVARGQSLRIRRSPLPCSPDCARGRLPPTRGGKRYRTGNVRCLR